MTEKTINTGGPLTHNLLTNWLRADLKDASKAAHATKRESTINAVVMAGINKHPELFQDGYIPVNLWQME